MGWSDVRHHYQDREQSEVDYRHLGTRYGTTRKDRRCHLCGGTMPAGTPFSAAAWIEDGRFQHMTHCRSPERCPVRERPCRACGGTGALWRGDNPESDRDEGYAEECQRCQGSGMVPKDA